MINTDKKAVAVFGGGCFWCTEAVFEQLRGVVSVIPGYAGGHAPNPTYKQVCSGKTGHAEVIKIEYDPRQITYRELLTVFFATHDPTTLNRQGGDIGTQYRSIILYTNDEQKEEAQQLMAELDDSGEAPIVTQVKPLPEFYEAEEEHQQFYQNNPSQPYCQLVISPKLKKLKERYAQLLQP